MPLLRQRKINWRNKQNIVIEVQILGNFENWRLTIVLSRICAFVIFSTLPIHHVSRRRVTSTEGRQMNSLKRIGVTFLTEKKQTLLVEKNQIENGTFGYQFQKSQRVKYVLRDTGNQNLILGAIVLNFCLWEDNLFP